MRVAKERLEVAMAADQRHLRYREAKFEESTDRLMAEVVESKIRYSRSLDEAIPR